MIWLAIAATIAALVGSVLHELTHAIAAKLLGADVQKISIRYLFVEYEIGDDEPLWKDRVIGLAPLLVGSAIGVFYYVVRGIPSTDLEIVLGVGWAVYALWGSLEDVSISAAQNAVDDEPDLG